VHAPVVARLGAALPGRRVRRPGRRPEVPSPREPDVDLGPTPDPDGRPPVHPLVAEVCAALDGAGVRWALLRGERELGDPRGDVDILIGGPGELRAVRRALRPLGVVAVPRLGAGAHRHFWGYHRPTRRWLEFDVEWSLDFGPQLHFTLNWLVPALQSGATRAVLARRRRAPDLPGAWVLHPDDGFWALLLHAVVDKARVAPRYADRLGELGEHATPSSPLAEVVTAACPPGWDAARVIGRARVGDWPALVALGRVLARRASARRPVTQRARALGRGLHRLGTALRAARATGGSTVAIVGPEGSGTSAVAAGLVSGLPLPARLVPVDPGRRLLGRRRCLRTAYHRLRAYLVVFDDPAGEAARDCRPDVVIVLDLPDAARPRSVEFVEPAAHVVPADRPHDEVLADVTAIVWRAWTTRRPRTGRG